MARFQSKEYGKTPPSVPVPDPCTCRGDSSACPRHPPADSPEAIASRARHPAAVAHADELQHRLSEAQRAGVKGPALFKAMLGYDFALHKTQRWAGEDATHLNKDLPPAPFDD